ncbi:MAG: DMT family transporter [Granulosicoccus sp.]
MSYISLAALWGASFLFMRISAPEFGPFAVALLRCAIAAAVLLPICLLRGKREQLQKAWRPIAVVGVINSGIPFALFGFSALVLPAGMISILNSSAPFFAAIVAWFWLKESLTAWQLLGLLIGFFGVVLLVSSGGKLEIAQANDLVLGVGAALLAGLSYGVAASYMKRRLAGIDSLTSAAGSQISATLFLLIPGAYFWPAQAPALSSWVAVVLLGVFSTALAYLLFFRLIANLGASRAITVTFLIPAFGIFWGALVLAEAVSLLMLLGALVIVGGCVLTTKAWPPG